MTPLVSVIVPSYNHRQYLPDRLQSIFTQTVQDFELILLDDASKDGSGDFLRTLEFHPKVSYLVLNENNTGSPFVQWERGVQLARGMWIWIAESDDTCEPNILERLLDAAKAAQSVDPGIAFCQSRIIDEIGVEVGNWRMHTSEFDHDPFGQDFSIEGPTFIRRWMKIRNVVPNASAVIFKRELCLDNSIWKSLHQMKMAGDWLFWIRLMQNKGVVFVADALNDFRKHEMASRNHNTLEKRRRRLSEERQVREELASMVDIHQQEEVQELYRRWCNLFGWRELIGNEFQDARLFGESRSMFALSALQYKMQQHRARAKGDRTFIS